MTQAKKARFNLTLIFGFLLTGLGVFFTFIFPFCLDLTFRQLMVLKQNSFVTDMWKDIPIAIPINFYVFHLENPNQFLRGAKPKVKEVGPYRFL